jgi:hypothetical protein
MTPLPAVRPMLTEMMPDDQAWRGPALPIGRYLLPIPPDCLAELERVVAELRAAPVPTLLLAPEHFALVRCTDLMAAARERLDHGPGFVILDTGRTISWVIPPIGSICGWSRARSSFSTTG